MATKASDARSSPTRLPGRRERNKLEKRQRIIAAARSLFAAQGFAETTTLQIAEAADIGSGTLFLYARSKEDLLVMVFKDEMLATALDSFRRLPPGGSVIENILLVFDRMVDYHERDIDMARVLMRELVIPVSGRAEVIDELMQGILGGFADLVRAGQDTGEIAARIEPPLAAQMIFALYYFGLLGWLSQRTDRLGFRNGLRLQLEALLGGAN